MESLEIDFMVLKKMMTAVTAQAALLDELLELLGRETTELSAVNIAAMTQTNQAKEALLKKISENAQVMQQAIADMATGEGLAPDSPFGVVAEHLSKKGLTEPLIWQARLKSTAEKIRQVATMNHGIAERFSSTIATSLNLVTRIINQSNVYGATGGYKKGTTGAVMINREA